MKLAELLKSVAGVQDAIPDLDITAIAEDSRKIAPGALFIARAGTATDGAKFLADAASRGAAAAVVASRSDCCPLPQVVVSDPASAISPIADTFYGHPSEALRVIAITGTNGKTTSTYLIRDILRAAGIRCGLIGTVQIDDGTACTEATMTTPSPIDVSHLLARMRDNGCGACAIEVSSHALDQGRVGAIRFAAGAFTNLTGDHLDYHKTMDAYAAAKAKLFEMLPVSAAAVVNARDAASPRIVRDTKARVRRFGIQRESEYRADDIRVTAEGTTFTLQTPRGSAPVRMLMIGRHNVENALTAVASVAEVFDIPLATIAEALSHTSGAPGRLQRVQAGQPFAVLVDYAHTDDALANVLSALRPLTPGQLRVLFGCGGDRDGTKRPRMARIAQQLADVVYVTSDNPRTEDPSKIINEILVGFEQPSSKPIYVEPDRRSAIARVLHEAKPGDVVLLAGKGHENYQILGTTKHHFDDVEESMKVLK